MKEPGHGGSGVADGGGRRGGGGNGRGGEREDGFCLCEVDFSWISAVTNPLPLWKRCGAVSRKRRVAPAPSPCLSH